MRSEVHLHYGVRQQTVHMWPFNFQDSKPLKIIIKKKDTFHIYLQYYCDTMPDGVILQKYVMPVLIVLVYTLHVQLEITGSIKQSYLN